MTRQTLGARLYRLLLRLYPREFQEEYGAEMSYLYRDRARNEGAVRLWLALLADVFRTAPNEQLIVLMQDSSHAFRQFLRTPIVTATALLTIALGVGGSTAVFSVVYAVMLRPLPYPQPDRLVELFEDNPRANMPMFRVSALNYLSSPRGSRCPAPSIRMQRARGASGADCWNRSTACHRYSPWRSGSRRHSGPVCARAAGHGTVVMPRGSRQSSTW